MSQLFPRVGGFARGYDPDQVEEFFAVARQAYEADGEGGPAAAGTASDGTFDAARVRGAAFDLVRRGYAPAAVDSALDRLESAFLHRERSLFIEANGESEWTSGLVARAATLYDRLTRPPGERFAPPARGHGYDYAEVDALLAQIVEFFDSGVPLTAAQVRQTTFRSAPRNRAYGEGPVDAFLDRVVDVLLAVE